MVATSPHPMVAHRDHMCGAGALSFSGIGRLSGGRVGDVPRSMVAHWGSTSLLVLGTWMRGRQRFGQHHGALGSHQGGRAKARDLGMGLGARPLPQGMFDGEGG